MKSLYGLKQANCQWNAKLTSALLSCGYTQSNAGHSMFTKRNGSSFNVLLVYMDDVLLSSNDLGEINYIKSFLDSSFKIKNLGPLKFFLGIEITRTSKGLHLCQRKYALDLLFDVGLLSCKPILTPMETTCKL